MRENSNFRLVSCIVGVFVAALSTSESAQAQPDEVIQAVEKSWKEREAKLGNVRMEWEKTITHYKGSRTDALGYKTKSGEAFPLTDRILSESFVLLAKDRMMRFEHDGYSFDGKKEDWGGRKTTAIYDGKENLEYTDQPSGQFNVATHRTSGPPSELRRSDLFAVVQSIRPASSEFAFVDLAKYRATGRSAKVNGRDCLELSLTAKPGFGGSQLWVDPKRGYVIVRKQSQSPAKVAGTLTEQSDIEYREAVPGLWIASSWTTMTSGRTIPLRTKVAAIVKMIELPAEVPSSQFSMTTPPKTLVHEVSPTGAEESVYIVKPDGSKADFNPRDRQRSYSEMMGTATSNQTWWGRHRLTIAILGAIGLVLALGVPRLRKAWLARRTPNSQEGHVES